MATEMQKGLAEAIVKNKSLPPYKRKSKKELLVSSGYALKSATSVPSTIIEAKGVKDALREWGLTEELITTALVEDIKGKKKKRVKELGLGAEILGMKKQEPHGTTNNLIIIGGDQAARIARRAIARIAGSEESSH